MVQRPAALPSGMIPYSLLATKSDSPVTKKILGRLRRSQRLLLSLSAASPQKAEPNKLEIFGDISHATQIFYRQPCS